MKTYLLESKINIESCLLSQAEVIEGFIKNAANTPERLSPGFIDSDLFISNLSSLNTNQHLVLLDSIKHHIASRLSRGGCSFVLCWQTNCGQFINYKLFLGSRIF